MNPRIRRAALLCAGLAVFAGCSKAKEPAPAQLSISGTIQLDPKLAPKTKASDVIFLIARPAEGGPPLAVRRYTGNQYPIEFTITQENLMMPQQVVEMPLNLSVRVDKDGDAMTKLPGDLSGTYEKNPVPIRAEGVSIVVNEVQP
jgi:cytochrome c-type biogenesis protein CcmH